jgi:hypothetical protein
MAQERKLSASGRLPGAPLSSIAPAADHLGDALGSVRHSGNPGNFRGDRYIPAASLFLKAAQ